MSAKPVLIVIAGPNGSGKTTITEKLLPHAWTKDSLYINPDDWAQTEFGGWDFPGASLKAAQKADLIREECLRQGRSLVFETVFSTPAKIDYLRRARAAGFFIRLFFICTNAPEINVSRIERRQQAGGHGVPPDKILSRYAKSIANCALALPLVDRAYLYDNSVDNADPVLLFRTENGLLKKVYHTPPNPWAQPLLDQLTA